LKEDLKDYVDSLMLRVKPEPTAMEQLIDGVEKAVSLKELTSKLKNLKWVPTASKQRKSWARELYEDSEKIMKRGVQNEATCKKALYLANHAAFLETE